MAQRQFTFQTALKLNSSGFKKGVNEVKKSLDSLKKSFTSIAGALGLGLGFGKFVSDVKDTALQLSVAKNTLENVSKVTKTYTDGLNKGSVEISNYAENLAYVRKLAKDYSQDLITLTENFAKFTAACNKTNLSLEDQKLVFEALTRAAAYYHMPTDQVNNMTMAITQMMSKGKVTAEELRRQLGNALPGAFNLMAAALGVTTAQLEDMMRKGEVISSEALPKFAAMLNTVTKNADFDSLQMSINRLKNTWAEFVDSSGAENIFKKIVNGANSALGAVTKNINEISSLIKGLVVGILGYKLFSTLQARGKEYLAGVEKDFSAAVQKLRKEAQNIRTQKGSGIVYDRSTGGLLPGKNGLGMGPSPEDIKNVIKYNDALIEQQKLRKQMYGRKAGFGENWLLDDDDIKRLERANKELKKTYGFVENSGRQSVGFFKSIGSGIKSIAIQIKGAIASMGIMAAASAIIGALTSIYSYIKKIKEEQKRVNNLVDDYVNNVRLAIRSERENAATLDRYKEVLKDESKGQRVRVQALKEINKMMGTSFSTDALDKTKKAYQDIIKEVERWTEATKVQARIQAFASQAAQAEIEITKINIRNEELKKEREKLAKGLFTGFKLGKIEIEEGINKTALDQYKRILDMANFELDALNVKWLELSSNASQNTGGTETDISKVFDKYNDELKELENKLKEHAITQEEYNNEFDKLMTKFWEAAAATGKMSIDKILDKMDKGKTLTKMEQWYFNLYQAAQQAALNTTIKAAQDAIDKATDDAIKEADKEINEAIADIFEKADRDAQSNLEALTMDKPKRDQRDKTFDYNKSRSNVLSEEADTTNDYVKQLEKSIEDVVSKYDKLEDASKAVQERIAKWKAELALAKKEASTLEEAMKLAKIQEDIDDMNKAIADATYGGIKNLASSMDRIVKGAESLRDVFEDSDSTGWEKFMAVFNELIQIIDSIISVYQTMKSIKEITTKLDGAENALIATRITLLEKELELRRQISAAKAGEQAQAQASTAAALAEAAASNASASANAREAIAGGAASAAKIPFPYNIAGMLAVFGTLMTILGSMGKFANGGIVGGNSYSGDKQLARVNSGEMLLNRQQQATLFNAIKSGKLGGGQVTFKIRGTELLGCINNEMSRRKG